MKTKTILLLIFLALAVPSTPAFAIWGWLNKWLFPVSEETCREVNATWRDYLHRDLKASWPLRDFDCPGVAFSIAEAARELRYTTFHPDGSGYSPDFYGWVVEHTERTDYQDTDGWGALARSGRGRMTIYAPFADYDLLHRTSTLVHETRHQQSDDPGHETCTHGVMSGQAQGCDPQFFGGQFKGGAFNYGVVYMWWVQKASKRTNLDKQIATSSIRWNVLNRFSVVSNEDIQKFAR
jgi:hypothetical protein